MPHVTDDLSQESSVKHNAGLSGQQQQGHTLGPDPGLAWDIRKLRFSWWFGFNGTVTDYSIVDCVLDWGTDTGAATNDDDISGTFETTSSRSNVLAIGQAGSPVEDETNGTGLSGTPLTGHAVYTYAPGEFVLPHPGEVQMRADTDSASSDTYDIWQYMTVVYHPRDRDVL